MAILLAAQRIFVLDQLVAGLTRVRRSVVRVTRSNQPLCTGWIIAPHLVVVPGYSVVEDEKPLGDLTLQTFEGQSLTWESKSVEPPEILGVGLLAESPSASMLAVVRVDNTPDDSALKLRFGTLAADEPLVLLHYPDGRRELSVSVGRAVGIDDALIRHDADSRPGSSGGPLFDTNWSVTSMHTGRDPEQALNRAVALPALVKALRSSRVWPEIARHHGIADLEAAQEQVQRAEVPPLAEPAAPATVLLRAAAMRVIDPAALSKEDADALRPSVVDPDAPIWMLRSGERDAIVRAAGSIDALRAARGDAPTTDAGQRVIDRILAGPPYSLTDADEEALSWWIQAARWFAPVAPELPTPAQISALLERRRVRSRLRRLMGPKFHGRTKELGELRDWYAAPRGPLSLTGIGGIGKSALVGAFASSLPDDTLLLWLDFDRADLAPDDAVSVLEAIRNLASVQVDGFAAPAVEGQDWQHAATELGTHLQATVSGKPSLLVLDSFEAAQYDEQYQELWPVLEAVAAAVPTLRMIVTGRAPVAGLSLRGQPAVSRHLAGLEDADARSWLEEQGITTPAVRDRVVALAAGIPLVLRLAVLLVESGEPVENLPSALPPEIVAGFLYRPDSGSRADANTEACGTRGTRAASAHSGHGRPRLERARRSAGRRPGNLVRKSVAGGRAGRWDHNAQAAQRGAYGCPAALDQRQPAACPVDRQSRRPLLCGEGHNVARKRRRARLPQAASRRRGRRGPCVAHRCRAPSGRRRQRSV